MGKRVLKTRLKPADVQMVIWESPTAAAAARALNVHESSVSRWLNAGKFTRRRPLQARPHGLAPRPESGTSWPDQIRRDYALGSRA